MTGAARKTTRFAQQILRVVSRIPPGRVTTYGDVARLAGRPGAARAVGSVLAVSTRPGLPYHRVVAAGGCIGGYGSGPGMKTALLVAEGVVVRGGRIRQFARHRWPASNATRRRLV